jgi:hypothetical protein
MSTPPPPPFNLDAALVGMDEQQVHDVHSIIAIGGMAFGGPAGLRFARLATSRGWTAAHARRVEEIVNAVAAQRAREAAAARGEQPGAWGRGAPPPPDGWDDDIPF